MIRRLAAFVLISVPLLSRLELAHATTIFEELKLGYMYKPYGGISYAACLSTSGGGDVFPKIGGFTHANGAGLTFANSFGAHAGLRWHKYAAVQFGYSMVGQRLSPAGHEYTRNDSLVHFKNADAKFTYTYSDLILYSPHVYLSDVVTLELTTNIGLAYVTCKANADQLSIANAHQFVPKYGIGIQIGILGFLSARIGVDTMPFRNESIGIKSLTVYSIGVSFYL